MLQNLKKAATIKVTKERETLGEVEMRLENSSQFKRSLDEEKRLSRLSKLLFIQDLTEPIRHRYDSLHRIEKEANEAEYYGCLLYTSPSPRDQRGSRMPSSA